MPILRVILVSLALLADSVFAQNLGVERRQDLGFGFHRDVIAEATPHSFEAVGHFEYLFYRDQKLCQLDECAVAPSGDAIIYQDGPSGNIFLFRRNARLASAALERQMDHAAYSTKDLTNR